MGRLDGCAATMVHLNTIPIPPSPVGDDMLRALLSGPVPVRRHFAAVAALVIATFRILVAPFAPPSFAADHLFVVTSDFVSQGNCATLGLQSPWPATTNLEPLGVQAFARHYAGVHYIVSGSPDNDLRLLDPVTFELLDAIHFDSDSDAKDALPLGDGTAYVSFYNRARLLRIDLATHEVVAAVNLAAFADGDGLPEMGRMIRDGGHVFVQLKRIDRRTVPDPPAKGALAVVDVATNTLVDADAAVPGVQPIELSWFEPAFAMTIEGRILYVSEPGGFYDQAGGIEAVDLDELKALGLVYTEKAVGAAQSGGFIFVSPTRGYILSHTDLLQSSHLVAFSRTTGTFLAEHFVTFGLTEEVAFDPVTGLVYFPDNEPSSFGVRVFDAQTGAQLTPAPIGTGLPATGVVVARGAGTDVGETAANSRERPRVWAAPNPATGAALLQFEGLRRGAGGARLVMYDASGRAVRTWETAARGEGAPESVVWDGRDAAGMRATPGVYFLRLEGAESGGHGAAGGSVATGRVVLVR